MAIIIVHRRTRLRECPTGRPAQAQSCARHSLHIAISINTYLAVIKGQHGVGYWLLLINQPQGSKEAFISMGRNVGRSEMPRNTSDRDERSQRWLRLLP